MKHSHKPHVHLLRTMKGVIGMLRDPHHTESVFDIEDGLRHIEASALSAEHVRSLPGVASLMDESYLAPPADVDALHELPQGSLGKVYAEHITSHGFDADYFRRRPVETDVDYVQMRMRQTHDIWHVVTGFGVGSLGELGLKAFELAQTRRPMAAVITTGGVLRYMLKEPEQLESMLQYVAYGYRLGSQAEAFLAQRWELEWELSLEDWRRRVKHIPVEETPYTLPTDPDRAVFEPGD